MFIKRKQENGVLGIFLSLYWHSSAPLVIIIEAVCFYCCSFFFFFFEPHYRWLGYLLKTEMMMIFFDAKKSKTRGSYAVSIRDLFFFYFFLKENLSTFLQSQTAIPWLPLFFYTKRSLNNNEQLWCVVYTAQQTQKTVFSFFFFFFFFSFVE